jgi:hypothetical protein
MVELVDAIYLAGVEAGKVSLPTGLNRLLKDDDRG